MPFILLGTKKRKNSHLKIKFFQKSFQKKELPTAAPQKTGFSCDSGAGGQSVFTPSGSAQAECMRYTVSHRHRRSEDYKLHEK